MSRNPNRDSRDAQPEPAAQSIEPAAEPHAVTLYRVTSRLKHNGKQYEIAQSVGLTAKEAAAMPWAVETIETGKMESKGVSSERAPE